MNKKTLLPFWLLTITVLGGLLPLASRLAAQPASDEFFIITSVDIRKHEIVLKMPTEVTVVAHVTPDTVYLDEHGQRIRLTDLRAGDTVYATIRREAGGVVLLRLRKGPMTVEELHRRYLKDQPIPGALRTTAEPHAGLSGSAQP
jgi:hypothetical protein